MTVREQDSSEQNVRRSECGVSLSGSAGSPRFSSRALARPTATPSVLALALNDDHRRPEDAVAEVVVAHALAARGPEHIDVLRRVGVTAPQGG
jgi:hypothetical protein